MKWWLNDNLRQARIIKDLLSTTSYHWYLGNKYLLHAYFSSVQPCVGCFLAWISLFENHVVLARILMKPLYCKCDQVEMRIYYWKHIKIMLMILLSHICQLSNFFAYQFLNKLTCAILMKLQIYFFCLVSFILILVIFIKASQLSSFPCWYLWCLWHICGWSSSIYNKIN
jgi:hypothetical protein